MTWLLGKALQVSGLLTLMWALWIGLTGEGMFAEVAMLAAGAAVFYVGRWMEARGSGGQRR